MKFKDFLLESSFLKKYDDYVISFNHSIEHKISDRLERLNISIQHFNQILKRICKQIKENNDKNGYYNFILKRKKNILGYIIVKFTKKDNKKDVFILTILDKTMNPKNFDYKIELFDGYKEVYNNVLNENDVVLFDKEFSVLLSQIFKERGEVIGEFNETFFIYELNIN